MKIKNRLYISAGISIILVVILFSLALVTSGRIAEGNKRHELLDNMRVGIAELNIITYDYLLYREERMEQQWNSKYNSLGKILEKTEEEVMKSIGADYAVLGDLFTQLTANYQKRQKLIQEGASPKTIDAVIRLEERLVTQLLIASHSVITNASRLAEGEQAEIMEAQRLDSNLTLILIIILAITVTTSSLLVARSISKPLSKLADYSRKVGEGEYTSDIEIKGKDEVASVASDVKSMVGQLLVTSEELKKELTERKKAEEKLKEYSENLEEIVEERTKELRDAQEQLVRSEKLAILGQLAGGVGHELRNPLGSIKNAAYFLKMALEKPEPEVKETLEILNKEVATSEHIISSLLDFARPKPPTRHKVEINHLLQETLSRTTVPENIKVVSKLDKSLPQILADPEQLSQVFRNLILNALQTMSDGGQLEIRAEVSPPAQVAISFADTGVGIPEDNLEKLFEPLFTTRAKGIGLGLAITKTLVKGHKGTIEVQSKLGKGSIFTVRLPLEEKEGD